MKKVVILGAGEHGRSIECYCRGAKLEVLGFLDDTNTAGTKINGVPVLGGFEMAESQELADDILFHVALGDPATRIAVNERLRETGRSLLTLIHPRAEICTPSEIGEGAFVGAFALISVNAKIENYVIVNSYVSIAPDARMERGSWVAPRSSIGRGAVIGERSFVGLNVTVLPDVKIGVGSTIGANSLVTKDIPDDSLAYGTPCRVVRRDEP